MFTFVLFPPRLFKSSQLVAVWEVQGSGGNGAVKRTIGSGTFEFPRVTQGMRLGTVWAHENVGDEVKSAVDSGVALLGCSWFP